MWPSVVASFAVWPGFRNVLAPTISPSRILLVSAAHAASAAACMRGQSVDCDQSCAPKRMGVVIAVCTAPGVKAWTGPWVGLLKGRC